MTRISIVIVTGLALTACAADPQAVRNQADAAASVKQLSEFTVADLAAADADAVAAGDVLAHACYPALAAYVQTLQAKFPGTATVGVATAFQRGRDLAKGVKGGIPVELQLGCAPLVMDATTDVRQFLIRLGTVVGGASVGVPLLP